MALEAFNLGGMGIFSRKTSFRTVTAQADSGIDDSFVDRIIRKLRILLARKEIENAESDQDKKQKNNSLFHKLL